MMVAVRNIYKQQVRLEKDSRDLQVVLLDLIEEAQRNGNIIRLLSKEDLDNLLAEKHKMMSQHSFSSIKSPLSQESTASARPSLFGKFHATRTSVQLQEPQAQGGDSLHLESSCQQEPVSAAVE
ncbi:unnamed protein product, partial [Symbiodinium necroappetens]